MNIWTGIGKKCFTGRAAKSRRQLEETTGGCYALVTHRDECDDFVDKAFAAAGIDVLHVKVRTSYVLEDIRKQVHAALEKKAMPAVVTASKTATPVCPNCRTLMIHRTASKGPQKGSSFWGCENYPTCRMTIAIR